MSLVGDAVSAMRDVVLLADKVDRLGGVLEELSREIRDHDRRLVRLETMVEMSRAGSRRLPDEGSDAG